MLNYLVCEEGTCPFGLCLILEPVRALPHRERILLDPQLALVVIRVVLVVLIDIAVSSCIWAFGLWLLHRREQGAFLGKVLGVLLPERVSHR